MGRNQIKLTVTPKDTYFGSEQISGELQLVIQKTINIREISLELVGNEHIVDRNHKYVFLKSHIALTGGATKEQTLTAGNTYVFNFTYALPSKLPASCKFNDGELKYTLIATVNVKFSKDLVARQDFHVSGDAIDSEAFINPVPFVQSETKTFLIGSGDLSCKVTSSKQFVYIGDEISLHIEVNNQSSKKISSVTTQFIQRMTFSANPGSTIGMTKRKQVIDPQKAIMHVDANSSANHTAVIRIRTDQAPSLENNYAHSTRLIRVWYKIRVIVEVSKATDMKIDIPITLKKVNPLTDPKSPLLSEQMKNKVLPYGSVQLAASPYNSQNNLYATQPPPNHSPYSSPHNPHAPYPPAQPYPPPTAYPLQAYPPPQNGQYPPASDPSSGLPPPYAPSHSPSPYDSPPQNQAYASPPQGQPYPPYHQQQYPPYQTQPQPYPPQQGQQPYPPPSQHPQPYPPPAQNNSYPPQPYPPYQTQPYPPQPYPPYSPPPSQAPPPSQSPASPQSAPPPPSSASPASSTTSPSPSQYYNAPPPQKLFPAPPTQHSPAPVHQYEPPMNANGTPGPVYYPTLSRASSQLVTPPQANLQQLAPPPHANLQQLAPPAHANVPPGAAAGQYNPNNSSMGTLPKHPSMTYEYPFYKKNFRILQFLEFSIFEI